jgi:hypothetical protein
MPEIWGDRVGIVKRNLRALWVVLNLSILILAATLAFHLHSEYRYKDAEERSDLDRQVRIVVESLEQRLEAANSALSSIIGDLPGLLSQANGRELISKRLQALVDAMPGFRTFVLTDAEGGVIASNRRDHIGRALGKGERYATIRAGGDPAVLYVPPPYTTQTGIYTIGFGKVVQDRHGGFGGILLAVIEPEFFETLLNSVRFTEDTRATLVHGTGKVVYSAPSVPSLAGADVGKAAASFFNQHMQSGRQSNVFSGAVAITGDERLVAVRTTQVQKVAIDKPMVVSISRPVAAIFSQWHQHARDLVGMFLLLAIAANVGMFVYQRWQLGHLRLLEERDAERRQAEAALRRLNADLEATNQSLVVAKEAADAANVAKSTFLGNMSHELRTPLHQINGLLRMVRREPLSQKQMEQLEMLDGACARLTSLVNTILEFASLETGKIVLSQESVSVERLVHEAAAQLQHQAAEKGLELTAVTTPAMPADLVGDSAHLRRALFNYVTNAIRFTDSGKVVVRALLVEENSACALVRFEVEDTGIGIAADDVSRLFSIFEQADNSSTRRYGGLGAGLAITRKIAQSMGGEAGCASEPGKGSTFWFTARLRKATSPA